MGGGWGWGNCVQDDDIIVRVVYKRMKNDGRQFRALCQPDDRSPTAFHKLGLYMGFPDKFDTPWGG